jgi:peptide deformylase
MELIKGIELSRQPARTVKSWFKIKKEALELMTLLDDKQGKFPGTFASCYALHHAQVNKDPFNFFILARNIHGKQKHQFLNRLILNPEILESDEKIVVEIPIKDFKKNPNDPKIDVGIKFTRQVINNIIEVKEGCMSFPDKKDKLVKRYYRIKVKYQIVILGGLFLKTKKEILEGLKAHVFQHEYDHAQGKNIFYA